MSTRRTLLLFVLAMTVLPAIYLWKRVQPSPLVGTWTWSDSSIFEFQKIQFRFSRDSFFLAQRFINPKVPAYRMPCAQRDYWIHAAGRYLLSGDSLRFLGNFTDDRYSRDTLRLCRDTGFKGTSHVTLGKDTIEIGKLGTGKKVRLVRAL